MEYHGEEHVQLHLYNKKRGINMEIMIDKVGDTILAYISPYAVLMYLNRPFHEHISFLHFMVKIKPYLGLVVQPP